MQSINAVLAQLRPPKSWSVSSFIRSDDDAWSLGLAVLTITVPMHDECHNFLSDVGSQYYAVCGCRPEFAAGIFLLLIIQYSTTVGFNKRQEQVSLFSRLVCTVVPVTERRRRRTRTVLFKLARLLF
jgi:hypothetical protein